MGARIGVARIGVARTPFMAKTGPAKPKKAKTKAEGVEKDKMYYCTVCGCKMVCVSPAAGEIICCDEPMCIVC
jgi:hypothetical protein